VKAEKLLADKASIVPGLMLRGICGVRKASVDVEKSGLSNHQLVQKGWGLVCVCVCLSTQHVRKDESKTKSKINNVEI
jgi:hypothetical protein